MGGSLKEIKGRITSTSSTQKVTAAMKMVASSKLNKVQLQANKFSPYQKKSAEILNALLLSEINVNNEFVEEREIKRVAIIAISSNTGLCGAFNTNIQKLLVERLEHYKHLKNADVELYPVGKKITEFIHKNNLSYPVDSSYTQLANKPDFNETKELGERLMLDFINKKIDRVEILYNHYKNNLVQIPTVAQILPIVLNKPETEQINKTDYYIIEPDKKTALDYLIPKSLFNNIYSVFLDSLIVEHTTRAVAMQIATDNATDLLDELTIQYNKQRQQKITNELLDIVSGSEALK